MEETGEGEFFGLTAKMWDIKWKGEGLELPVTEEYSIGIPTLSQNGAVACVGKGRYVYDRETLRELLKTMLADDYGCEVESLDFDIEVDGEVEMKDVADTTKTT